MPHGVINLSVIFGIFFAVCTFLVFLMVEPGIALVMSLFSGAFTSLLMSVFGWISLMAERKKFASVEKLLQEHNVCCEANGAHFFENTMIVGRIYFCENGEILFIHFKGKKHTVEAIQPNDIQRTELVNRNLIFHIASDEMYTIMITKEISDTLKDKYNVV